LEVSPLPAHAFQKPGCGTKKYEVLDGSSLALIGNASGQTVGWSGISVRGVFDKETRRKPLAFAADAVRYGI